jgi:hypothetical protein
MPLDDRLRHRVTELVADYLHDRSFTADPAAEPVAVRCGTAVLYVRLVDAEPPVVRVFSPLLRRIQRSPELLTELNELNAQLNFQRVFWRDGTIYAACELLADTLTAAELTYTCDVVADAADYYDARLHARFGGQTAFAERRPG